MVLSPKVNQFNLDNQCSNSHFGHRDFKVWSSLHACHSEGATYRHHCSLMVEKKMFFQKWNRTLATEESPV
jgi:hypothetical protein